MDIGTKPTGTRNSVIAKSVMLRARPKIEPTTTVGRMTGTVTLRTVVAGLAPSDIDAVSSSASICSSAAMTGRAMTGSTITTCAAIRNASAGILDRKPVLYSSTRARPSAVPGSSIGSRIIWLITCFPAKSQRAIANDSGMATSSAIATAGTEISSECRIELTTSEELKVYHLVVHPPGIACTCLDSENNTIAISGRMMTTAHRTVPMRVSRRKPLAGSTARRLLVEPPDQQLADQRDGDQDHRHGRRERDVRRERRGPLQDVDGQVGDG